MLARKVLLTAVALAVVTVPHLGAQQITGRVLDQASGQPLAAVQVFIGGSGIGALSQQNGRYLLLNVPVGTHTINAQLIGYGGQEAQVTVAAGETAVLDFRLNEQALGLDEIIVTGTPGGTQRRAIGNTVATVSAADLTRDVSFANVQTVLQGRTPGVRLAAINGTVGSGTNVEVRGVGSFNLGRNPLIYVDGIRVNNDGEAGPRTGGERVVNVFNDFNPADIESIEIIKGPAAATLYGTEASAGVIQIITKRGQEGAPQFDVSIRQGVNYIRNPAGRVGTQYTCVTSFSPPCSPNGTHPVTGEIHEGGNLVAFNMHDDLNEVLDMGTEACARSLDDPQCWNQYWTTGPVADGKWPQENIFQDGRSSTVDLGVRGGTDAVRYFLQGSYTEDNGVVWYNWNNVFRGRANIGVVLSDNFSLDVSTGYVQGDTRFSNPSASEGGIFTEFGWGVGYCIPTISDNDPNTNPCPRILGFQEHLPTDHQQVEATRDFKRFTGSATLNYTSGDWLSSRAIVGLDQGWDQNNVVYPIDTRQEPVYFRKWGQNKTGSVQVERPVSTNLTMDWAATATTDVPFFDNVSSQTSFGAQYYLSRQEKLITNGMDFASPLSRTINQASISSSEIKYTFVENKSAGFYVQEQLSFSDRFFLTGAVRWDDNSAFGALRGGEESSWSPEVYPKVSGTWVITEESFWGLESVNSLRLRGAWGKAGRQPNTFAGVNTFGVIAGMGGGSALNPESVGNSEVGPETGTEIELGFDYAIFDDRFSGEFTWFSQRNENALLDVTIPPSFGSGNEIQKNLGRIDNWGWEATLDARLYESSSFTFDLGLQGAYTMNEIISLGDFPGSNSIKIGFPYPNMTDDHYILDAQYDPNGRHQDAWGRQIQGYCDQGVVLDGSTNYKGQYGTVLGGNKVKCKEADGYHLLAGSAFPPYVWSVAPRFSLFDNMLSVNFLFDGAYGGMKDDDTQAWHDRYNSSYDKRCQCNPAFVVGDRYRTYFTQAFFPGDFWKLREIGVRLNPPDSFADMIGAERASLSLSMREVAILWQKQETLGIDNGGRSGNPRPHALDPEIGRNSGSGHRVTPPLTNLHLTLNVTF